jgi:hypothetical protein
MEENTKKIEDFENVEKSDAQKVAEKIIEIDNGISDLENLKGCYAGIKNQYDLPAFDDLNFDFGIEKIQGEETDILIREVRKYISDKFSSYLRLVETLLSPNNAQMFVFMMLKSVTTADKEMLQSIYKKLAKKEIELIELDLKYNIDAEVAFINSAFELWQEVKKDLLELVRKIKGEFGNGGNQNNSGRYFG